MNYTERFQVEPKGRVELESIDAGFKNQHESQESALPQIEAYGAKMRQLQYLMYAQGEYSLLIVLQGRDAAGKDGVIKHVFGNMNPQGCSVTPFKTPTKEEAAHDFLWRCHKAVPAKGSIAIFNRSHYEDVLIQRVHDMVPKKVWSKRYEHINNFEKVLYENGTHILKFYLHIDADEQLERFKQRIDDPKRHWKISEFDYSERPHWDAYTDAYEEMLQQCSTQYAPWFVIPSNHKWFRNLAVSQIICEKLESLNMEFPPPQVDIDEIIAKYHAAKNHSDEEPA
jgi:PPK2 family polyphosphate:nucleotide phosphotransferase